MKRQLSDEGPGVCGIVESQWFRSESFLYSTNSWAGFQQPRLSKKTTSLEKDVEERANNAIRQKICLQEVEGANVLVTVTVSGGSRVK